jgi:hypothetical protein
MIHYYAKTAGETDWQLNPSGEVIKTDETTKSGAVFLYLF